MRKIVLINRNLDRQNSNTKPMSLYRNFHFLIFSVDVISAFMTLIPHPHWNKAKRCDLWEGKMEVSVDRCGKNTFLLNLIIFHATSLQGYRQGYMCLISSCFSQQSLGFLPITLKEAADVCNNNFVLKSQ